MKWIAGLIADPFDSGEMEAARAQYQQSSERVRAAADRLNDTATRIRRDPAVEAATGVVRAQDGHR